MLRHGQIALKSNISNSWEMKSISEKHTYIEAINWFSSTTALGQQIDLVFTSDFGPPFLGMPRVVYDNEWMILHDAIKVFEFAWCLLCTATIEISKLYRFLFGK